MKPSIFTHLSLACATIAVLLFVVLPFDTMPFASSILVGSATVCALAYGLIAFLSRNQ